MVSTITPVSFLRMGVELEYELTRSQGIGSPVCSPAWSKFVTEVRQEVGTQFVTFVPDGSLTYGIELKTSSPILFYDLLKQPWDRLFKVINNFADISVDPITCGFHIHVENKLSAQALERLFRLIHENESFFKGLSNRGSFARQNYYKFAMNELPRLIDAAIQKEQYKYYALAPRGDTIEFRFFGPTKDETVFQSIIEVVQCMVEWSCSNSNNFLAYLFYSNYTLAKNYTSKFVDGYVKEEIPKYITSCVTSKSVSETRHVY